ncbi:MAG TPA: NADPH:quinone oxidoreductase family protein [Solirubrobacteraceae bacterium]|nr:NADPH:quinone oxidoreductase family protein [Solirubrobacteraceae bacterium]
MRALLLRELTGPAGLRVEDVPEPEAVEGLVVLDVHAAGAGFVDMLVTRGEYQIRPELPFVPGIEAAGVVRSAPAGSGLHAGDRVAATTAFGAFAEVAVAPAFVTFPIPDDMSFEVAAGMVVNYQTAHLGLVRRGRLAAGEAVLVHGAAGGVGIAAIQVAKAAGAGTVVAVAGSAEKQRVAREAGADVVLGAGEDWVAGVREATGGAGADIVVDPVGGERFDLSLRCMAPHGRLLVVGFAGGTIPTLQVNRLLLRSLDVVGVNYGGSLAFDQAFPAAAHEDLIAWWQQGLIDPPVGTVYPLEDGARALEDFAARRVTGKAVIRVREAD